MRTSEPDWVAEWARRIAALGLSSVAIPLLEILRAFRPLGSNGLLLAQPLLRGLVGRTTWEQAAALLDDPDYLTRLQRLLEEVG